MLKSCDPKPATVRCFTTRGLAQMGIPEPPPGQTVVEAKPGDLDLIMFQD
jgi:hypothetical protein